MYSLYLRDYLRYAVDPTQCSAALRGAFGQGPRYWIRSACLTAVPVNKPKCPVT